MLLSIPGEGTWGTGKLCHFLSGCQYRHYNHNTGGYNRGTVFCSTHFVYNSICFSFDWPVFLLKYQSDFQEACIDPMKIFCPRVQEGIPEDEVHSMRNINKKVRFYFFYLNLSGVFNKKEVILSFYFVIIVEAL